MIDYEASYNYIQRKYKSRIPPLKNVLRDAKFLSFIFIQRPRIRKWNSDSGLITFSSFGMHLELESNYRYKLEEIFLKHILKLGRYINEILNQGWKMSFLSIWEYNVIVHFKDFFDDFYQVVKEKEIIKQDFYRFEKSYVKISYKEYYPDAVKSVFTKYLKNNNKRYKDKKDKIDEILDNLTAFFDSNEVTFLLRKLIIAFNMVQHKYYYKWEDLYPPLQNDIVEKKYYKCSRDIFEGMTKYYTELIDIIESLKEENIKLLKLKNNCDIGYNNDPPIIVKFYQDLKHNWKMDKANYSLLFLLIIKGLIKHLYNFIYTEWELLKEGEVVINQYIIMDKELPHLYYKLKREYELVYSIFNSDRSSAISIDEFQKSANPEVLQKTKSQKQIYESFRTILKTVFEVSQILEAYDEIAIQTNYTTNRYLKYIFNNYDHWTGKPVFALFNYYIELCWTICSFFKYETFRNLDKRLEEIKNTQKTLVEEKNRIDRYNILSQAIKQAQIEVS